MLWFCYEIIYISSWNIPLFSEYTVCNDGSQVRPKKPPTPWQRRTNSAVNTCTHFSFFVESKLVAVVLAAVED